MRQLRQPRQQFRAPGVGADVAAIEQDVALRGQRRADGGQLALATAERGGIQLHRAQAHAAFGAVADDVDRVDAAAAAQRVGDLLQAIAGLVQHDDFGAGPDLRDQLLVVLDLVVHEHDLAARRFRGHGHAGQVGAGRRGVGLPRGIGALRLGRRGGLRPGGMGGVGCGGHGGGVEHEALFQRQRARGRQARGRRQARRIRARAEQRALDGRSDLIPQGALVRGHGMSCLAGNSERAGGPTGQRTGGGSISTCPLMPAIRSSKCPSMPAFTLMDWLTGSTRAASHCTLAG